MHTSDTLEKLRAVMPASFHPYAQKLGWLDCAAHKLSLPGEKTAKYGLPLEEGDVLTALAELCLAWRDIAFIDFHLNDECEKVVITLTIPC